ncbi:hypothetical protein [Cognatiyoonia sp. IB215182]|uniref:hypothetical protein n=1 Tax=Cognatiyoonia sp. IB215182 TaxID=3097353 RepID=UPI002A23E8CE|nr:hypothetical protein [Cognatiyoonia sp. IB215182]
MRDGSFALAQSLHSPYIAFFDLFSQDNRWDGCLLSAERLMYINPVTRQFLRRATLYPVQEVAPIAPPLPSRWIHQSPRAQTVMVFGDTDDAMDIMTFGADGATLVEKDILRGGPGKHPSGIYDRVVIETIADEDDATIDGHELMSVAVYPNVNERLLLNKLMGHRRDPMKDLQFNKPIPTNYLTFMKIISGKHRLSDLGY